MLAFFGLDQAIFISYTPIMMMYDSYRIEELQKVKLYVFCGDPKKFFQGGPKDNCLPGGGGGVVRGIFATISLCKFTNFSFSRGGSGPPL